MSHVLQRDGVDAALACLSRHEGQLLERARAGAATQDRGLRRALSALLLGIPLLRNRGNFVNAERLSERLLAAEPDWPLAQQQHIATMIERGEQAIANNSPIIAWRQFGAARTTAEQLLKQDPRNRLCQAQLMIAYVRLSELIYAWNRWDEADTLVDKGLAIAKHRAAADPSDIEAQWALLETYGKAAELRLRTSRYGEAAVVYEQADQVARTLVASTVER